MKIGIMTLPLGGNIGCILQNYALQQVLKDMGHIVETIDWEQGVHGCFTRWLRYTIKSVIHVIRGKKDKPQYELSLSEQKTIFQNTTGFIKKYISISHPKVIRSRTFHTIDEINCYDAYVVGSDQVWRPSYNTMLTSLFLDFVEREDVKRIAYAASFGTDKWEYSPEMTRDCCQLVRKFNLVAVREKSGVNLCKEHLGVVATHVLDPTMLLDRENYENLVAKEEPHSEGSLFHYILDPSTEKRLMIEKIAKELFLQPFTVMPICQAENRTKWDVKNRIEDCIFPPVTSWLRGFIDAELVIIDSFHGAVFSIIFNKPFWVISNGKRGNSRFESLLNLFGLEERMVSIDDMDSVDWKKEIDWIKVNAIRKKEQIRCKELLRQSLS